MAKILIADDQPKVRLLLSATLKPEGYNVIEAEDGTRAWDLIRAFRPDLVVLDVQMPGKTGLDLTSAIRKDPALAGTKIILLTALAHQSVQNAGIVAGADRYVTKPFSPMQLLEDIEALLDTGADHS